ncbi:PREDICTED: calcium-activated chloride channel regulator 1-like [Priapulus caudatus]|uniref:Calcium-activated chloride channel regulator 1-like n=1 Tax=Priapulus caudatus TaxID=37621 RepID=A0ABM1DSS2_PRICU|nr:PREDICTED: calcium-activated chloride channel regulator 1-like [Priapulus caudatus]
MSFSTRTSVARPTVWQRQLTSVISGLRLYMLLLVFSTILPSGMAASRSLVYLQHNGYKNLQVAVDESVEESEEIIARIKDSLTDASRFLYTATRKRAYFEDISILVPKTWSDQPEYLPASTETMATADIRVDYPDIEMFQPFVYNPNPCGKQGDYMLLNPHYLMNDSMVLGPHAKVIVHEWAHLRWGVYDEYPGGKNSPRVYASKGGDFTGNRCSAAIKGRLVNLITGGKCHVIGNRPPSYCVWQDEDGGKPAGSLMYRQYLTQIDGFCDSDELARRDQYHTLECS